MKLTKPQIAMLREAEKGVVLATAGKPTAWRLEREGLLAQGEMRVVKVQLTATSAGTLMKESYAYEFRLTDEGRAALAALA